MDASTIAVSLMGINMTRLRIVLLFTALLTQFTQTSQAQTDSWGGTQSTEENSELHSSTNPRSLFTSYNITNVKIRTHDQLQLDARLYEPKLSYFPGTRPAIVFTNSWTLNEYEYELQARKFAAKGYIVLAYSTRGFGGSQGTVTVAGPKDVKDFTTVLDWLETNTRVDNKRIGMAGVSYGGGLALLASALEPRVRVVAAMSGWGNLAESLYRNETIQKTWLDILVGSGTLTGNLDPDIFSQIKDMEARKDPEATRAWALLRSPETYVDRINAKGVPVFLQNSYLDALFPPLQIRPFYEKLSGPKRMMMDEGIHASSAIPGILGLPSPVWSEVHDWMDHFLVDSKVNVRTGISFQDGWGTDYYTDYPELSSNNLELRAVNNTTNDPKEGNRRVITFRGNTDSGATTGIPILSDTIDSYTNLEVKKIIANIDKRYAAVFQSKRLSRDLHVQGSSRVHFTLMPHDTPVTLVVYLYDENTLGIGSLASFSVTSFHEPSLVPTDVSLDLNITSFKVEKAHRLTVAIDTLDSLYSPATREPYELSIAADSAMMLELPMPE